MKRKQTEFPSIPVKSLRLNGSSYRHYAETSEKLHSQNAALGSIMVAAQSGQLDIVKYHLNNTNKNYSVQCFGPLRRNLLHLAAVSGNKELIEYILNENLASLWKEDECGKLPCNLAAGEGKMRIMKKMNWEKRKPAIFWFAFKGNKEITEGVFRRLCQKFVYNLEISI